MNDTRLNQAAALLDDARCLLIEIVDEGPHFRRDKMRDFNNIDSARLFINSAVTYIQAAQGDKPHE